MQKTLRMWIKETPMQGGFTGIHEVEKLLFGVWTVCS